MGLGEEDHRVIVPFSLHHMKGAYYQYDLELCSTYHLAEVVLGRFLYCKLIFSPLFTLCSLEESHYVQPTFKKAGITGGTPT